MGFVEAVKACFAKYATFDGRACLLNIGIGYCSMPWLE